MLRHLTARAMAPAGKAVAGLVPLLRPAAVRCASGAAAWAPPAQKQQAPAARGQQQRAQSYTYEPVASEASPEIGEADFDPAAANTVRLIGVVGGKKELRVFERSKLLPFAIGVKLDRRRDETDWINVEAWGPLAERADAQLQKGDRIALQGRLKLDKWQDAATGAKRTAWKITASSISKVRSTYVPGAADAAQEAEAFGGYDEPAPAAASAAAPAPWDLPAEPAAAAQPGQAQGGAAMTAEEKWMDYFENPSQWWDNRTNKRNPKAPDFKKKGGSDAPALWISGRDTPAWVAGELERMDKLNAGA